MAIQDEWGKGASNNNIGWGQGADNPIGWGNVYEDSWAGDTNIVGETGPSISISQSLFNFSYEEESGPSSSQILVVAGSDLTNNIIITPTSNYQISLNGVTFQGTPITLTQAGGSVASTNVYIRLKAGLLVSNSPFNETIVVSSIDADTRNITCNGIITAIPAEVNVSPLTLGGFTYAEDYGPSTSQLFNIDGNHLTDDILISTSSNYEISLDDATFQDTTITLTQSGGMVASTDVYVRLKDGLLIIDSPFDENITISSSDVTNQFVLCEGEVTEAIPTVNVAPLTLNGFTYEEESGPSASQMIEIFGSYLVDDILVTAPTNYEVSLDDTTFQDSITLIQSGGSVGTNIYVRLKAGLLYANSPFYGDVEITSTNATDMDVSVEGEVTELIPVVDGQQEYTTAGTYTWTAPNGVTSVCVVAVGGGYGGTTSGGGGGGLGWKNDIPVIPGNDYTVVVGAANNQSYFINDTTVAGKAGSTAGATSGGSYVGDGGGNGGDGVVDGRSGGGAGGYSGNGGAGGYSNSSAGKAGAGGGGAGGIGRTTTHPYRGGSGGGVGIYGEGASGTSSGQGGSGGANGGRSVDGGLYGGGGGGSASGGLFTSGGTGAVRIIWGDGRAFPSTNTEDIILDPGGTPPGGGDPWDDF